MSLKNIIVKFFLWILLLFLLFAIGYGAFFLYKLNALEKKVSPLGGPKTLFETFDSIVRPTDNTDFEKLKKDSEGRINFLLLGTAGEGKPGRNLTDTIIVSSVNLKTNQVALLSLPRDLLVIVPEKKVQLKINSLYQYGLNTREEEAAIEPLLATIRSVTALDIHYYAVLNFDGFVEIIDSIGGININNERDIYDPRYPGPNYSYELFELKKGFHHLDGETALKYARERHADPDGDFGRAKRQQQTLQAVKNRVFSASTFFNLNSLNELFAALEKNLKTNLTLEEVGIFYELTKRLDTANIISATVDAWNRDSLLKVSHVFHGETKAFVLIPRVGNYSEIHELAEEIFDLNKIKRRREKIAEEKANIILINKSQDKQILEKIKKLLSENLVYKNVQLLSDHTSSFEENTVAYDTTNGMKPFTLDELAVKLPASVAYAFPEKYKDLLAKEQPDIVVIIGKDLIERYAMEEDSLEDFKKAQENQEYLDFSGLIK